jgi:basic amino acid/polyamine antiporter, APA family
MIGAGVFAAIGPAASAAGSGLLAGLVIAAAVAYCNATSSAELAALYPRSGGTYVYGRARLGHFWGYLAGWGFVVGKTASCAAMALTVGAYAAPSLRRPIAIAAVVALTAVNYQGVRKTALLTRVLVALVLTALAVAVVGALIGGHATIEHLDAFGRGGVRGVLESAGLLFFAFAGYARIATLGEEVIDPARTIPKAIPLALAIALAVYATVAISALVAVGPAALAASDAPLATAVSAGTFHQLTVAVRVGGTIASLSVLLALIAGVTRTTFAMASNRDMPSWLDAVHPRTRTPHRAELAVGVTVAVVIAVADLRGAIGFSSFAVLTYYAIANASALTLPSEQRRWPRVLAAAGVIGCAVLAFTLPPTSVIGGVGVLALGAAIWAGRHTISQRTLDCSHNRR